MEEGDHFGFMQINNQGGNATSPLHQLLFYIS